MIVDGKEVLTLSSVNTADGTNQLISNRLSGYGTATVDVVKDPFLLKLIKSDLVVGTVMFLERIGAGVYTSKFIGQPIISEYLSMLDSIGAKGLFTKTNLDAVKSKFVTTDKLIENASIDIRLENLDNNIKEYSEKGELSEAKNAEQHRILDEFLKYAKMAEYSFKLTQAINYDTTKFRSGDTLYRKERRTEIAIESNIFAGIDDVLNETAVGYQAELLGYYNSAMGYVFKLDQDQFKVLVRDSVLKPFAQNDYLGNDDYERIANKVRAAFLDYIIETKTTLGKEIRSLLVDPKTSVAARVQLAKQKYPEIKILQELEPVASNRVEGATSLKLKVNDGSALSDNLYIDMMRELRDASPELNELYNDIVKVAILQGTYKSGISFKNIIPVEDYSKIVSPIISQLVSDESLDAFAQGSFQRNNFKDDSVMPLVQPKFFLASDFPAYQQVNSFGEFYADIYQYYSTLFPNIEEFGIKSTSRMILLLNERYNAFDVRNDFVKVPRVVTDKTTGESIDMKTGTTITAKDYATRKKKGDLSLTDVYGYMKVKDAFGNPLTYINNEGDTVHVYKLINLYGDGSRVVEHHTDFVGSSLDNGTVKIDVEIPNADLITYFEKKYRTKLDKPTKDPVVETYKNIKVVADSGIATQTGEPGAASYNRKDGVIKINREFLKKKFEEKAWTKPRKQRDGSFATALPENAFTTYKQFENFVMEHEYQHSLLSEQQFRDMSEESVTIGQYEDEINRRALAELNQVDIGRQLEIEPEYDEAMAAERKSIFEARSNPLVYTTDQTIALQDVQNLIDKNEQGYYLLAGYAGTGKTTIAENIARYAQMNGRPVFIMAPTNKAAKVLNEKLKAAKVSNTEATTIHRAIYGEPDPITGEWIPKADVKNSVVIIDESSMISKEVMKDLLDNTQKNNILIFMGDSFQLEPVGEDSGLFRGNVAEVRDSRTELKEVRRQSLDSNVLKVATITRIDNKPYVPSESIEDFKIVTSKNEFVKDFKESVAKGENSVMIVATNNERVAMNNVARDAKYGADKGIVRNGDVMISVANSSDIPNSETFKINTVRDGLDKHQITFTFGDKKTTYDMHIVYFTDENNVERKMFLFPTLDRPSLYHAQILKAIRESNRSLFDNLDNGIDIISTKRGAKLNPSIVIGTYGYAITAHKSQGSQWDKVYVNQNYSAPSWNPARWYYTAITRSSKEVVVFPTGVSSRIPVAEMNKKINDATVNESTPKDEGKKDPFTC